MDSRQATHVNLLQYRAWRGAFKRPLASVWPIASWTATGRFISPLSSNAVKPTSAMKFS